MCGITGLFDGTGQKPIDARIVRRMTSAIAHRGPDGDGHYDGEGIALGHRRLAIIDLSGGAQPMWDVEQSVCIVFNGEIYNFRELADELAALGYRFNTHSDTEVILNAWRAWGTDCFVRFSGMFAFAIWEPRAQTLTLARDRLGKKPLYYTITPDGILLFASELKALVASGQCPQTVAADAVEDYLTLGYVPDPKTIYRGVHKLPPGSALQWTRGAKPKTWTYWDFTPQYQARPPAFADAVAELAARLATAVKARLISEVPLGAFLSGGVDSSGIVAYMAKASAAPVKTCTIGFTAASHDERDYARRVAERYHTDHAELVVSPEHLAASREMFDRIVAMYDEPFADSSALPTFHVCALARQRVTVALSGDGGDEAFAGYRRYAWHVREDAMRQVMPQAIRGPLFGVLARLYPALANAPRWLRARNTFKELSLDSVDAYVSNIATIQDDVRLGLYSEKFRRELQGYHSREVFRELMKRAPDDSPLLQAQYADLKTWLAGRMLVKVDRASMANGLEVRNPLLDHDLVQWALSLPDAFKCHNGAYKIVLKKALEPDLPSDLLYRPKQGFSMPLREWLAGPLQAVVRDSLTSPALLDTGWFERRALSDMAEGHISGRRDHAAAIWSLIVLERFLAKNGAGAA